MEPITGIGKELFMARQPDRYFGAKFIDDFVTSTKTHEDPATGMFVCDDPGTFSNK